MGATLVTGATGFIGPHVVGQLLERGEQVRVLVRTPSKLADVGFPEGTEGLEVVQGDLLEPDTIPPALDGVQRVHHIAGSISLHPRDRERMFELNATATQNIFDAIERTEVERTVYLASIFALAGGDGTPATEESPWLLEDFPVAYVQAKRLAELDARRRSAEGLPIVFAYPGFCYGPGDVYRSSSGLVLGFLEGSIPGYVNGGHNAMDVRDAAAGLIAAMDKGELGERYLLGGVNLTFEQLFAQLSAITGRKPPRIKLPSGVARMFGKVAERVISDPPLTEQLALMTSRRWYYDDAKARTQLGHTSRPLEQTMRDAIEWFERRGVG